MQIENLNLDYLRDEIKWKLINDKKLVEFKVLEIEDLAQSIIGIIIETNIRERLIK